MRIKILGLILFIVGCVGESGRTPGTFFKAIGAGTDEPTDCRFIDPDATFCSTECDITQNHIADKDERAELENALRESIVNLTEGEQQFKIDNFVKAQDVCVPGLIVKRPEDSVFVNSDYCGCQSGKRITTNNCDAFCAGQSSATPTLYGSVSLGADVINNPSLGSLERWCNAEIEDGGVSPSCVLRVFDGSSNIDLNIDIPPSSNSFTVNISTLAQNRPYTAKIIEIASNTNFASSTSFQFMIFNNETQTSTTQGPLWLMPISQYTCFTRVGSDTTGTLGDTYTNGARLHFYFASNDQPQTQPPGSNFLICHDPNVSENDSPLLPRLELVPQSFTLWSRSDPRFRDLDGNGKVDANDIVQKTLLDEFGVDQDINLFAQFQWPNGPQTGESPPTHGFFMQAFVDPNTGRAKCPKQDDYEGADLLFKSLREVVGTDTEAIYTAEREPRILIDDEGNASNAPPDFLLIRESILKKVWFYFENNLPIVPDDITINQKTILFYYPPDIEDPYVRKSTQDIYIIRSADTLGQSSSASTGSATPDKRFGCIPATESLD
jgi:hypothetical protein